MLCVYVSDRCINTGPTHQYCVYGMLIIMKLGLKLDQIILRILCKCRKHITRKIKKYPAPSIRRSWH
jgi:hypothetical protein